MSDTPVPAAKQVPGRDSRLRWGLGAVGVLGLGYGLLRLAADPAATHPVGLGAWLVGALVLHDGILVPVTMTVGALLTATVPARPRRALQALLVTSALVTAIALPMIYRRGTQPSIKAQVTQDYAGNLTIIIGLLTLTVVAGYLVRRLREARRRPSLPDDDHRQ